MSPRADKPVTRRHSSSRCDPSVRLSAHTVDIVREFSRGKRAVEVAGLLGITADTVYELTDRARQQLGARNMAELIRLAIRHGFIDP
jgi:DNA-binding CsgD family transcriptional regulator